MKNVVEALPAAAVRLANSRGILPQFEVGHRNEHARPGFYGSQHRGFGEIKDDLHVLEDQNRSGPGSPRRIVERGGDRRDLPGRVADDENLLAPPHGENLLNGHVGRGSETIVMGE